MVEGSAPRVLAVATVRGMGGAEVVLLRILRRLRDRGLSVTLATPGPGELREAARAQGLSVAGLGVPAGRMGRGSLAALTGCVALAAVARRADVVLVNGRIGQRLVPGAALAGRPVVVYIHDLLRPGDESRLWRRGFFWRTVRSVLVPSDAVARTVTELGVDPDRVRTARVAVELDPPAPAEAPDWAGGDDVVGFVGRLEPRKGVIDLVRAAPKIAARRPGTRIVLVGDDDFGLNPEYTAAVRDAANGSVEFAGRSSEAAALMRYFSVLAYPSLEEPGGTAAAEALAAGVPVVAADTGGMSEVVVEGQTGSLVPAGDPQALADAVVGILERPDRGEMGRRARAHAELFSAERSADVVEEALREAAAG